jgi:hypothetical protein
MSQTRRGSLVEAIINVLIGFGINFTANALIFPLFGWHISSADNLKLGLIYTAISIARSYCIRRWFNGMIKRAAENIAK